MQSWLNGTDLLVFPANLDAVRLFVRTPWRHAPNGHPLGLDLQQALALSHWMGVEPGQVLLDKLLLMQQVAQEHFDARQPAP